MIAPHFSSFLIKQHSHQNDDLGRLFEALSEAVSAGSSCISLELDETIPSHSLAQWIEWLDCDGPNSVCGSPASYTPLVLTPTHELYLRRYYTHEKKLAELLTRHIGFTNTPLPPEAADFLRSNFDKPDKEDLQRTAAETALRQRLCIISGGPGTGKTTTVAKILALLKLSGHYSSASEVLMLAPTGKAADRLRQSIQQSSHHLLATNAAFALELHNLPRETSTIHRALGYIPNSTEFRHNQRNPLPHKILLVDESSMVDLPLMSRLLAAMQPEARIILLGDKNQLSSVQVGTVLADLMRASQDTFSKLSDCVVTLTKTYRNAGAIKNTCDAIRDGEASLAWRRLRNHKIPHGEGSTEHSDLPAAKELELRLTPLVTRHWLPILKNGTLTNSEKLRKLDDFRILTPVNNGPYGINAINKIVERVLHKFGVETDTAMYLGRLIILHQNDAQHGLFNGDTGLSTAQGVTFTDADEPHKCREFPPNLLPEHSSAWALTIHRTQGSEYGHILMIIPPLEDCPIFTRELLYTGLSRAKKHATVWTQREDFQGAVTRSISRASGLHQFL